MGLEFHFSTSFHPPIDRQTKKVSILLEQYLRQYVSANQRDWTKLMIVCQFSYIVRRSEATNKNSFEFGASHTNDRLHGKEFYSFQIC